MYRRKTTRRGKQTEPRVSNCCRGAEDEQATATTTDRSNDVNEDEEKDGIQGSKSMQKENEENEKEKNAGREILALLSATDVIWSAPVLASLTEPAYRSVSRTMCAWPGEVTAPNGCGDVIVHVVDKLGAFSKYIAKAAVTGLIIKACCSLGVIFINENRDVSWFIQISSTSLGQNAGYTLVM
ncbi:hypothetical protein RRG08_034988 [Elysia crispata]|uniref:Uncharacterized protein n=1 Tax=Elysia crispata TaxID=231223 RepID=A0AAE0Y215_9GAST|nr:hypothetical protein RRG08_034988 [Elysia crispata]